MTNVLPPEMDMTYDEWVKFIFDHPVRDDDQLAWYWEDPLKEFWGTWMLSEDMIAERQLEYATRLFQLPAFLLSAYSPEQINQGFWFLLGGHSGFALVDFIWDPELPWVLREQCIRSMTGPFQVIFTQIPVQDACNMWWDMLRNFGDNVDSRVIETMLQTMADILQIPNKACQVGALHGLGHIKHNGKNQIIHNYLQVNINLDSETRDYALAALEGKIL